MQRRSAATVATLGTDLPLCEDVTRIIEGAWAIYDNGGRVSSSIEFFVLASMAEMIRSYIGPRKGAS